MEVSQASSLGAQATGPTNREFPDTHPNAQRTCSGAFETRSPNPKVLAVITETATSDLHRVAARAQRLCSPAELFDGRVHVRTCAQRSFDARTEYPVGDALDIELSFREDRGRVVLATATASCHVAAYLAATTQEVIQLEALMEANAEQSGSPVSRLSLDRLKAESRAGATADNSCSYFVGQNNFSPVLSPDTKRIQFNLIIPFCSERSLVPQVGLYYFDEARTVQFLSNETRVLDHIPLDETPRRWTKTERALTYADQQLAENCATAALQLLRNLVDNDTRWRSLARWR